MKDSNNLDNLFKDGHQKEYPYDPSLWSAVNQELNTLKPRNNRKKILVVTVVLLAGIAGLLAVLTDKNENQLVQESAIESSPDTNFPSNSNSQESQKSTSNNSSSQSQKQAETPIDIEKNAPSTKPNDASIKNPIAEKTKKDVRQIGISDDSNPIDYPTKIEESKTDDQSIPAEAEQNQYVMATEPLWWEMSMRNPSRFNLPEWELNDANNSSQRAKSRKWYNTITFEHLLSVNGKKVIEMHDQELQNYRNNSEKFSIAQEYNLLFSWNRRNFFFQTGLGQKTIQEKVSYQRDEVKTNQRVVEGDLRILQENYLKDGQMVTLLGREKKFELDYDTTNATFYSATNRFSYFKVPFQVGFSKRIQRMEFGVWGLTDVLFLREFDGQYVSGDVNAFPVTTIPVENKVNFDAGFGVRTSYAWKSNLNVGVSFQQKYMLQSSHVGLNQKFNMSYIGWFVGYSF